MNENKTEHIMRGKPILNIALEGTVLAEGRKETNKLKLLTLLRAKEMENLRNQPGSNKKQKHLPIGRIRTQNYAYA